MSKRENDLKQVQHVDTIKNVKTKNVFSLRSFQMILEELGDDWNPKEEFEIYIHTKGQRSTNLQLWL